MATHTSKHEDLAARLEKLERRNRWAMRAGTALSIIVGVLVLSAGQQGQPKPTMPTWPGWVVVEKSPTGDDTVAIQKAIDSLGKFGGVVFFPAGTYKHTGLTAKPKVHLKGVHVASAILDYTPVSGNGITVPDDDPDNFEDFMISDVTLTSSGRSTGWAIHAPDRVPARQFHLQRVYVRGFLNGVYLSQAQICSIDQCIFGQTYPQAPQGIGIQIGNGKETGGNAVTIQDCYFSSLEKGVVTYAQACLILRPVIELVHTGIETHGTTTVVMPWVDGTTAKAHVSIQPNTVGGRSGTGALLVGYGSCNWQVQYGTDTERRRTIVIPERLDVGPGDDARSRSGIKLGSVVIDSGGLVQLEDLKADPAGPGLVAGLLALVDKKLKIFDGTKWVVVGTQQ